MDIGTYRQLYRSLAKGIVQIKRLNVCMHAFSTFMILCNDFMSQFVLSVTSAQCFVCLPVKSCVCFTI